MIKSKIIRRSAIGGVITIFAVVVIISLTGTVPGQYEVGGTWMPVDPNAPGTKLFTTLTIYYKAIPPYIYPCGARKPVYVPPEIYDYGYAAGPFFMRIQKGNDLQPFSGNFSDTPAAEDTLSQALCTGNFSGAHIIRWDDVEAQEQYLVEFFKTNVIPQLFPGNPNAQFALKSSGQLVRGGDKFFAMMDMVIAVQE